MFTACAESVEDDDNTLQNPWKINSSELEENETINGIDFNVCNKLLRRG